MTLEKYQKFLKNMHKFDQKPLLSDVYEIFEAHTNKILVAIKNDHPDQMKKILSPFITDLLIYLNRNNIDFMDIIKDMYND